MSDGQPKCQLCGEPMPAGEEMFNFHGYSGPCPRPPLPKKVEPVPMTIDGLCELFDEMPEDWRCAVEFTRGGIEVKLFDPAGLLVSGDSIRGDDDEENASVERQCKLRIDHARRSDGLGRVFT